MKKFEITQEQIKELSKVSLNADEVFRKWFPEAFEKHLEIGKWYKHVSIKNTLVFKVSKCGYGWFSRGYSENLIWEIHTKDNWIEATPQEVETALIAEAKKRYLNNIVKSLDDIFFKSVIGNHFEYYTDTNRLWSNGIKLFDNGKWAEIVENITLEESNDFGDVVNKEFFNLMDIPKKETFNSKRGLFEKQLKNPNDCEYFKELGCIKDVCDCYELVPKQECNGEILTCLNEKCICKYNKIIEQKKSYSEEEVLDIVNKTVDKFCTYFHEELKIKVSREWFEQFKKK